MLTTVEGTYQDGVVRLEEPAPAAVQGARRVLVTFLDAPAKTPAAARPRFSWDEALARSAHSNATVSDAVIEERREDE